MIPQAVVLQCGAQHNTLVRVTLKLPAQQHQGHYQLIDSIRSSLPDQLAVAAVPYAASSNSIQYVCHKGAAAKLYKALGSLKQQLHFELEDVRSSITLQPMPLRQLDDVATAAISCSLRHAATSSASSGTCLPSSSSRAQQELRATRTWHMLWPGCFLSTDIAAAAPGAVCHALYAELDVTAQHPDKLLLNFLRAGAVEFQPFSPMQVMLADGDGSLPNPLDATDTDAALLACPDKLRAANRLLQGRPCCLLPDLRRVVVIKVHGPPSPAALQQLQQQWLQQHLLQLPGSIPFQLELAAHAESTDTLLVPSCCVLTSTGLSKVLPNAPGYVSTQEVQQAVVRDVCQGGGCALWGSKAPVALGPEKTAASAAGPAAAAATDPPPPAATFTYKASWSKASDLVSQDLTLMQLEAVAAAGTPPAPGRAAGAAASGGGWMTAGAMMAPKACAMTSKQQLQEDEDVDLDLQLLSEPAQPDVDPGAANAAAAASRNRRPPRPATDFSQLKAFLAKHQEQQAAATAEPASQPHKTTAPPVASKGKAGGGGGATAGAPGMTLQQRLAAAKAAGAILGKPAAPALRKAPAAGAAAAAVKPAAAKRATTTAAAAPKPPKKPRADAAAKKAAAAAAAAAGVQAPGAAPAAAVVDAGLVGLTAAAPAAAGSALPPTPTAAGNGAGAAPAAAAAAARKRTKAADLDLGAVTAKLQAAVAAGAVFKGVSVPELQCYLRAHKLGVSGKKADLEAKVVAHMGGAGAAPGGAGLVEAAVA